MAERGGAALPAAALGPPGYESSAGLWPLRPLIVPAADAKPPIVRHPPRERAVSQQSPPASPAALILRPARAWWRALAVLHRVAPGYSFSAQRRAAGCTFVVSAFFRGSPIAAGTARRRSAAMGGCASKGVASPDWPAAGAGGREGGLEQRRSSCSERALTRRHRDRHRVRPYANPQKPRSATLKALSRCVRMLAAVAWQGGVRRRQPTPAAPPSPCRLCARPDAAAAPRADC